MSDNFLCILLSAGIILLKSLSMHEERRSGRSGVFAGSNRRARGKRTNGMLFFQDDGANGFFYPDGHLGMQRGILLPGDDQLPSAGGGQYLCLFELMMI